MRRPPARRRSRSICRRSSLADVGGARGAAPAGLGKAIADAFLARPTAPVTAELRAEARSRAEDEAKKKLGEVLGR